MLNYKQIYLFGWIQTSKTGGQLQIYGVGSNRSFTCTTTTGPTVKIFNLIDDLAVEEEEDLLEDGSAI